jgi:TDG/mug DNA glycosylase family protein
MDRTLDHAAGSSRHVPLWKTVVFLGSNRTTYAPGVSVDPETAAVYRDKAAAWRDARVGKSAAAALRLCDALGDSPPAPLLDVGCGPGLLAEHLPEPVIGLDPIREMLQLLPDHAPHALAVQAGAATLPFATESIGGALAANVYVHVDRPDLPLTLAELHRVLQVDAPLELQLFEGDQDLIALPGDSMGGRRFARWQPDHLRDAVEGGGFVIERFERVAGSDDRWPAINISARRALTLPDIVGPGMRLLICGLNPSVYSAETLVGFGRPGNRFWPAALAAGLASVDRDPRHALVHHRVGMTDLVKRATPRADELTTDEYRAGLARVERLCAWLRPDAVCFVGLAGWRAAADRKATAGWQERTLGPSAVYVMPSTSGLNAHARLDDLTEHLATAAAGPAGSVAR